MTLLKRLRAEEYFLVSRLPRKSCYGYDVGLESGLSGCVVLVE